MYTTIGRIGSYHNKNLKKKSGFFLKKKIKKTRKVNSKKKSFDIYMLPNGHL